MNTERDTYNQIEYARESGREEGREEGLNQKPSIGLFVKGDIRVSLRDLHSVGAIPNCFAIECTSKSLSKIMCISA